jgi:N-acetylneuraminic acid mutarotase
LVTIAPNSSTAGALEVGDCTAATLVPGSGDNSLLDLYQVTLTSAGTLTLTLDSIAFDALLLVFADLQQAPFAFDDDGGGGGNARVVVSLGAGTYVIAANSAFLTADTGPYTLTAAFQPQVWQPTSSTNVPEARTEHTAVWTGAEMIVWGGHDGNSIAKNTGARFDPATNSWTSIATAGAPSARWGHAAIWTGTEMIIWGGYSGSPNFQVVGDGARYNPQTNSWSPLSATDQPSGRLRHTAVWTGSEMIVWGGFSCMACASPELATGARYDPVHNTWTATSLDPSASARGNHTAVWTGSRMIIWGGEIDSGTPSLVGTGAIYDPVGDSWSAVSAANAPPPTRCHSAIWTGSEMILFGGQVNMSLGCDISSTGTGARYDPAGNTWSPMATAPVSSTISGAPAVWTGTRLITWFESSGARYNATADTWNGISSTGAPDERRRHTLVWTGSRVIVWGGDWAGPLNSGGIYDQSVDTTP